MLRLPITETILLLNFVLLLASYLRTLLVDETAYQAASTLTQVTEYANRKTSKIHMYIIL